MVLKISVVTATLNRKDYFPRCIEGVTSQSYPHKQHVIIDGGSIRKIVGRYGSEDWSSLYQIVDERILPGAMASAPPTKRKRRLAPTTTSKMAWLRARYADGSSSVERAITTLVFERQQAIQLRRLWVRTGRRG